MNGRRSSGGRNRKKRRQEEEKRRKAEEKRLNEAFVDQMVNLSDRVQTYAARPAGRRVRLYPVIERRGMEIAALEFQVGWEGARAYIVRNPWDFAQRVLDGQHHAYGKGWRLRTTARCLTNRIFR